MPDIKLFHGHMAEVPAVDREAFAALEASFREPYVGVTTDGTVREGLYAAGAEATETTRAIVVAADAFVGTLDFADERQAGLRPLDGPERRQWTNAFATWVPQGLLLDDLEPQQRDAALAVVHASLSERGYAEARRVMRLNLALGDYIQLHKRTLGEWMYWFTIFGEPSETEPWGWQLMGHHLVLNCLVAGGDLVVSPSFMGAEIAAFQSGPFAGLSALQDEQAGGLRLVRALSAEQQEQAILHRSMLTADLPPALRGRVDGRHRGGAGRDNLVLPYEGIRADQLSRAQQELLVGVVATFVGRTAEPAAERQLALVREHLDETYFAWIGDPDSDGPFYYRVHSPVILVESDHHAGIFLTAEEAEPFHVHTIMRMPNAGDYGMALIEQHRAAHVPAG